MSRRSLDLSLYLVADPELCATHGLVPTVVEAVAAGVSTVQLRGPSLSDPEVVRAGRTLRAALTGTGVPLLVNDRPDLANEIGAAGAHLGQHDLAPSEARSLVGDEAWLGWSVSTSEQAHAAAELPPGTLDYLGVGPVWPTATKPDAAAPLGPQGLAGVVAASVLPCVAIGGIDAARTETVRACGADGVAVVGAICGQPDVAAATQRLRSAWDDGARA